MKPLPTTIKRGAFTYEQVRREGNWAIYRQTQEGADWERFEVVKIRKNKAGVIMGTEVEAWESYPSPEEWGICAWTAATLSRARELMASRIALHHTRSGNKTPGNPPS